MTEPSPKPWRRALYVAFPFVLVALGFELMHAFPYGLLYDDGYFYAQIGYNLGTLGRSSFDGVGTTSGYHLLWGGILGAVSAFVNLFTAEKIVHLYVFQVVFAGLATLLASVFSRRPIDRFVLFMLVVLGSLLMESLLLSCLLLLFAELAILRPSQERPRVPASALLVVALIPLVRFDALLIIALYCALLLCSRSVREALTIGAAGLAGTAIQVGLMVAIFGQPFSVSAMIKAGGAALSTEVILANVLGGGQIVLGNVLRAGIFFGLSAAVVTVALAGRSPIADALGTARNRRLLFLFAGGAAFVAAHMVSHPIPYWCYLPGFTTAFFVLLRFDLATARQRFLRRATSAVLAVLMLAFIGHKLLLHVRNDEIWQAARAFVDRIAEHVPPTGRIYQIDGSGFTGYFSGRSVTNGDGLVNTYDHAHRIRTGRLVGTLDEQGICYIITNQDVGSGDVIRQAGLVVRRDEVEEIDRTTAFGRFPTTDFVLWRRRVPACAGE